MSQNGGDQLHFIYLNQNLESMACVPVKLPAVTADFCAPNINFGQISKIYLGNPGSPMADWADAAEWTTRIDNTDAGVLATAIKELNVIGDKPRPERGEVEFSQGRKAYTTPSHTINIKVDETGDDNYNLVQFLDANVGQIVQIWWVQGKYMYGGDDGIAANLVLDDVQPESDEELNVFEGTITWDGTHADRQLNPLA